MSITVSFDFSQAGDLQAGDVVTFDVTATAGEFVDEESRDFIVADATCAEHDRSRRPRSRRPGTWSWSRSAVRSWSVLVAVWSRSWSRSDGPGKVLMAVDWIDELEDLWSDNDDSTIRWSWQ